MAFLDALDCSSNRDPLAEFTERLVAAWLGATLAANRVQKGWDLELDEDGAKVEVRYLANLSDAWVNEHHVQFPADTASSDPGALAWYALACFEGFDLRAVVAFPRDAMAEVCAALGKRHPAQDRSLQLTHTNFRQLLAEQSRFEELGLRFFVA
jgi:hypothetical protein